MKRKIYTLINFGFILAIFVSSVALNAQNQAIKLDANRTVAPECGCEIVASQDVSCYNGSDGFATVEGAGTGAPFSFIWSDGQTTATAVGLSAGTYFVEVYNSTGEICSSICDITIEEPDEVTITAEGTDVSCYDEADGFIQVTFTTGTSHELWKDGVKVADGPDANLQYTGLEPGSYVVKAFADGNQDAVCIAETPAILIEESPLLECEITSVQNASCATCDDGSATVIPIGGTPEYEYLWSDGQTTATAMNLLQGDYSVIITDANGCTSTCELTIDYEEESEENCTLTQGYYGNEGGLFCDELTTTELLDDYLLQEELVIGLAGSGSLTVGVEESDFVLMMLPGGGKSKVLTAEYNSTNYKTQEPFIYKKKKFTLTNTLLAQTLTLGLNLRIDGSTLSGLPINSMELVVYNIAECGGEAIGDPIYYALNESVYDELVAKYGNPTVGDLLEMANLSLADEYVPALYQPSLSDISDAVTTINEAFDECRIGSFSPPGDRSADELAGIINREENVSISAYPNPFMNSITIEFTMAEDTDAALEVYNMTGVKVASLYNGNVQANQTYSFNFSGIAHVNQGTFIYVLRAGKTVKMGRLVMMK